MERFRHGGDIYRESFSQGEWLDFSANINPLGLSDKTRRCLMEHIDDLVHYPDPEARELKEAIANHYGLPQEEIVLGNGAAELLYLFFGMMKFSKMLLPQPAFSDYERAALAAGSHVEYVFMNPEEGFPFPQEKLCALGDSVDCIVVGNPNNPTGTLTAAEVLEKTLDHLHGNTWLLVDESFMEFREDAEKYTLRHLVEKYPRLFVVQSLTKFYALPGLRLGFGVARPDIVKRMEEGKDVWNVNLLAQKAGVAALSDTDYQRNTLWWLWEEQAYIVEALHCIPGLKIFPPSVNFVLADVRGTGMEAAYILSEMKKRGILLRDCSNYPSLNENYIRMAIRSHGENLRLMEAWREIMGNRGERT